MGLRDRHNIKLILFKYIATIIYNELYLLAYYDGHWYTNRRVVYQWNDATRILAFGYSTNTLFENA
jgi:hypothetical protein